MRTFSACLLFLLLAACGQTGDLYLPSKTPPPSQQPDDQDSKKQQAPTPAPPPAP